MGQTWKFSNLVENVIASVLEADDHVAIEAFVDQVVDIDHLVVTIGAETIMEVLGESLEIDKVYTEDEIAAYVEENYGVDILNLDEPFDPPGYEERVRY